MLLEAMRLVVDDAQVAFARGRVQLQLGHAERFDVAAHRGERRHQLVRDVGEQLPAGVVGRLERARAAGEFVGHLVERSRNRGNLVAADVGRARVQIAGAEALGCVLHVLQPPPRRTEHDERDDHHADAEHPAATSAIVGPSLRTMRQNGGPPGSTATRPTGMPPTTIGANSPDAAAVAAAAIAIGLAGRRPVGVGEERGVGRSHGRVRARGPSNGPGAVTATAEAPRPLVR